jgi:hypothetical protein
MRRQRPYRRGRCPNLQWAAVGYVGTPIEQVRATERGRSGWGQAFPAFLGGSDDLIEVEDRTGVTAGILLRRHQSGDWGNVPPEDAEQNELGIGRELRILSSYGDGEDDDRLQQGPTPSTSI